MRHVAYVLAASLGILLAQKTTFGHAVDYCALVNTYTRVSAAEHVVAPRTGRLASAIARIARRAGVDPPHGCEAIESIYAGYITAPSRVVPVWVIVLHASFVRQLNEHELEAVVGHEIAHRVVGDRDLYVGNTYALQESNIDFRSRAWVDRDAQISALVKAFQFMSARAEPRRLPRLEAIISARIEALRSAR